MTPYGRNGYPSYVHVYQKTKGNSYFLCRLPFTNFCISSLISARGYACRKLFEETLREE